MTTEDDLKYRAIALQAIELLDAAGLPYTLAALPLRDDDELGRELRRSLTREEGWVLRVWNDPRDRAGATP